MYRPENNANMKAGFSTYMPHPPSTLALIEHYHVWRAHSLRYMLPQRPHPLHCQQQVSDDLGREEPLGISERLPHGKPVIVDPPSLPKSNMNGEGFGNVTSLKTVLLLNLVLVVQSKGL